jgi:hypothetical protein
MLPQKCIHNDYKRQQMSHMSTKKQQQELPHIIMVNLGK